MLASSSRNALSVAQKRIPASGSQLSGRLFRALADSGIHHRRCASTYTVWNADQDYTQGSSYPRPSGLRSQPWSFKQDSLSRSQVSSYNLRLGRCVDLGQSMAVLGIVSEMKTHGVKPDLLTYNLLLQLFANLRAPRECLALLDDMKALDIDPNLQSYNSVIQSLHFEHTEQMWDVYKKMEASGIEPDATTYMLLIRRYTSVSNLEMALRLLVEMEGRELFPKLETAEEVITLAAARGQPRLAIDLAENFEASSIRRLGTQVWIQCLLASSECLYKDGVLRLWPKVVNDLKATPDEGVCLEVLHTAGRHGLPELATDALHHLQAIDAQLQEFHFAPVIEALCRTHRIKDAMKFLAAMRSQGVPPTSQTSYSIFLAIKADSDAIDRAWDALDELHKEGDVVDVTAINVILQASVVQGDLQRAFGTYKIFPEFNVKPDVDTFNFLLSGCIAARHRELGDQIMADMKAAEIKPDMLTYERLVVLCLTGQTYEDAFFYLEEMKAEKFYPPIAVYEAIIRRCVSEGDSRYRLALEEMKEFGYEISPRLQYLVDTGGSGIWKRAGEYNQESDDPGTSQGQAVDS